MNTDFSIFNLDNTLIEGLNKQNITKPTTIQSLTIPAFLAGQDIIAESYTGSGKTLAFVLPIFEKIDIAKRETQAIILAPTHELVIQIQNQIKLLAKNSGKAILSQPIMGEVHLDNQIKQLREKPHIIVGSPGRILDLISKKKITAHTIQTVVLDEADHLLEQNQASTIKKLLYVTPKTRQLCIFSATITEGTMEIAKGFMTNPSELKVSDQTTLNPNIAQFYAVGEQREKFELLKKFIQSTKCHKGLIFVSQHTNVNELIEKLNYHSFTTATISGKVSKEERKDALSKFRSGKVRFLVSSDLSARGLDIPDITHVFHFDLPLTAYDYLHRAGRTARGLGEGVSICLVTPKELGSIRVYEKTLHTKMTPIKLIKGQIKNADNGEIIDASIVAPQITSIDSQKPKRENKYPKGFNQNKKVKDKPTEPTTKNVKANKIKSKKVAPTTLPNPSDFYEGTLSDALSLIEKESKFGKNYE